MNKIAKILPALLSFCVGIAAGYGVSALQNGRGHQVTKAASLQDELLQPKLVQFSESHAEPIAHLSQTLCHRSEPGQPLTESEKNDQCATKGQHGSELVQKLTASIYDIFPSADIVLQNAGTGRIPLKAGPITNPQLRRSFPFKNDLVLVKLRGEDLKKGLEKVLQTYQARSLKGAYPYATGLRFNVDFTQTEGSRLSNIEFKDRKTGQWSPLNLERTYQVLTSDFLAQGNDGYQMFVGLERQTPGSNIDLQQSLITQFGSSKYVEPVEFSDYSTQSFKK